ncbi:MAG: hypothetical protein H0U76_21745 [Ktedonobacteraceae bacterium]|nr:hypothetical protein [Ktedonobacteraceae bacterium]
MLYSPNRRLLGDYGNINLEQSIARAREQLNDEAFSHGWNTGQSMSEDQAITDALEGSPAELPGTDEVQIYSE